MDNPGNVAKKGRKQAFFRPESADDPTETPVTAIKSSTETGYDGSRSATDDDEDDNNYSSDIASAVATILESAANEPVPIEPSAMALPAQPSKSKKKVTKTKSSKIVKPKRSKSTIYPPVTGTNSKTRIRLHATVSNANVVGYKSKSKTSASIDALNLQHSNSFQAFDDDADDDSPGFSTPKVSFSQLRT